MITSMKINDFENASFWKKVMIWWKFVILLLGYEFIIFVYLKPARLDVPCNYRLPFILSGLKSGHKQPVSSCFFAGALNQALVLHTCCVCNVKSFQSRNWNFSKILPQESQHRQTSCILTVIFPVASGLGASNMIDFRSPSYVYQNLSGEVPKKKFMSWHDRIFGCICEPGLAWSTWYLSSRDGFGPVCWWQTSST